MESIKDKLLKIKALADGGYAGEAKNAKMLLERLLAKHGLELEDITRVELKNRAFKVPRAMNSLFLHVVIKVVGDRYDGIYYYKNKPSVQYIKITDLEYIEIEQLWEFHKKQFKKEYDKQIKTIKKAYIHKHDLTVDSGKNDDNSTSMSLDEVRDILSAMDRMDDVYFRKQLTQ